jgi:hypothetical protein
MTDPRERLYVIREIPSFEEDLEDGVEGHQTNTVFTIAGGQVIPDDDHGDTAGETDHDQPHHILRIPGQKKDGQKKHEDRADDPVLNQRERVRTR